jgi:hypothetical protein
MLYASSYEVRYAAMNGGIPGPWTSVTVTNVKSATTISGLTPENLNLELHVQKFSRKSQLGAPCSKVQPEISTWSFMLKSSAENLNLELHVEKFSRKSQLGAPC